MTTWAIAHRGASDKYPENTLLAFEQALAQKADAVECDVHLTADGEVVVLHDATVDRTTDGHGTVGELTLEKLRKLDAGSWKHGRFAGQRIPTLGEVVDLVHGRAELFVELKDESPELAARVVAELRRCGVEGQAWLFGAHNPTLEVLRQLAPDMRVRWHEGMELGNFVLTWPERLTQSTMEVFRQRGMHIFTVIVDSMPNGRAREEAGRMARLGVDGIICNRLGLLREALAGAR